MKLFVILYILSSAVGACGNLGELLPEPPPKAIENPVLQISKVCPNGTGLTYQNFGRGLLRTYCSNCHSSDVVEAERFETPLEINFDDHDDVAEWSDQIRRSAAQGGSNNMPPNRVIPAADRKLLREWISCGTP
jgi:hypothetical protein